MSNEQSVSANIKLTSDNGADIMLTVRAGATLAEVQAVIDVLTGAVKYAKERYKLVPASKNGNGRPAASANGGGAPMCPDGHGAMKPSTKKPGEFYCPASVGEHPQTGKKLYCTHKVQA